ncbi:hypothetical protein M8J77_024410 [Diaphorina citri]|nr:hypothetical protein M8J77_024410 [Diaphorina citri]
MFQFKSVKINNTSPSSLWERRSTSPNSGGKRSDEREEDTERKEGLTPFVEKCLGPKLGDLFRTESIKLYALRFTLWVAL